MNGLLKRLDFLWDIIYPASCIHCDLPMPSAEGIFCAHCKANVIPLSQLACSICDLPFVSEAATSHSPSHYCGDCHKDQPPFSKAITPFFYEGPLATAICKFKYEKKSHLAKPLGTMLADHLPPMDVDFVTAIPLHPNRLRNREFNQSLLLAREVSRLRKIPLLIDEMVRVKETVPQVGLHHKEREENIKGAFHVIREAAVRNFRILLIDDVYTTGATLKEGAKRLMRAGAKEVIVATIARMMPPGWSPHVPRENAHRQDACATSSQRAH
ncbi:MAG: ComF family protein [Nitrospirota bacterium]